MSYGSDSYGSVEYSSYEGPASLEQAIVVGHTDTGYCAIAHFTGTVWQDITDLGDVKGRLYGIYICGENEFWVCGGAGADGLSGPLLYRWSGYEFVDYSSAITDSTYLKHIHGNGPDNVWTVGPAPNVGGVTSGAWNFDGNVWTPTRQNTIQIATWASGAKNGIWVSPAGYLYTSAYYPSPWGSGAAIYSNRTTPTFAVETSPGYHSFGDMGGDDDDNIVTVSGGTGGNWLKTAGTWGNYGSNLGWIYGAVLSARSSTDYMIMASGLGLTRITRDGNDTAYGSTWGSAGVTAMAYTGQGVWVCGRRHGDWGNIALLTFFNWGSFSANTDYAVNSLTVLDWNAIDSDANLNFQRLVRAGAPLHVPPGTFYIDRVRTL